MASRLRCGSGDITVKRALLVGVARDQAIAPGLSRSCLTIGLALLAGVDDEKAFRFSFLLSIQAVLGALLLTYLRAEPSLLYTSVY